MKKYFDPKIAVNSIMKNNLKELNHFLNTYDLGMVTNWEVKQVYVPGARLQPYWRASFSLKGSYYAVQFNFNRLEEREFDDEQIIWEFQFFKSSWQNTEFYGKNGFPLKYAPHPDFLEEGHTIWGEIDGTMESIAKGIRREQKQIAENQAMEDMVKQREDEERQSFENEANQVVGKRFKSDSPKRLVIGTVLSAVVIPVDPYLDRYDFKAVIKMDDGSRRVYTELETVQRGVQNYLDYQKEKSLS